MGLKEILAFMQDESEKGVLMALMTARQTDYTKSLKSRFTRAETGEKKDLLICSSLLYYGAWIEEGDKNGKMAKNFF